MSIMKLSVRAEIQLHFQEIMYKEAGTVFHLNAISTSTSFEFEKL